MSSSFPKRVKRLATASRVFPNYRLAGFYEALSQTVTVLEADLARLEAWQRSPTALQDSREFLATAVHELTHWLDGTSTLWGQALLVRIHNAMSAWESGTEADLWQVLALHNQLNRGGRAPYYAKVDQPGLVGSASTWKIGFSVGLEYGADGRPDPERPMVLVSFRDVHDARICRVPLTEMALLEANAMWAEGVTRSSILQAVPEAARAVDWAMTRNEWMRTIYTSDLAVYSAAVHLVAHFHGLTDAGAAFEVAGRLATLALNLPASAVERLAVPADVRAGWGARVDALLRMRDPGFVFFVLCHVAPRYEAGVDPQDWLEATLRAAGLPAGVELTTAAAHDRRRLRTSELRDGGWAARAEASLLIGLENFVNRGGVAPPRPLSPESLGAGSPFQLPPVVLSDESLAPLSARTIGHPLLEPLTSLRVATEYEAWADEFVNACRF